MRLFTALWPVEDALRHLDRAVRAVDQEDLAAATGGVAQVPVHLPGPLALDLVLPRRRRRSAGHDRAGGESVAAPPGVAAPRLRLGGAGAFRGVPGVGVQPGGGAGEAAVAALGAGGRGRDVPRGAVDRGAAGGGGR